MLGMAAISRQLSCWPKNFLWACRLRKDFFPLSTRSAMAKLCSKKFIFKKKIAISYSQELLILFCMENISIASFCSSTSQHRIRLNWGFLLVRFEISFFMHVELAYCSRFLRFAPANLKLTQVGSSEQRLVLKEDKRWVV